MKAGDCLTSKSTTIDHETVPFLVKLELPGNPARTIHYAGPERGILHGINGLHMNRGDYEKMRRRLGTNVADHQNVVVPEDTVTRHGSVNHTAEETGHTHLIPFEFRKEHFITDPDSLQ